MKKFISVMMSLSMIMAFSANLFAATFVTAVTPSAANGIFGGIVGFVRVIANAFAAGMLLYVGIKYVMASANEKADLKKGSISYVIGAIIIFGASALLGILEELDGQIITTVATGSAT